jgi:hypothetical protein
LLVRRLFGFCLGGAFLVLAHLLVKAVTLDHWLKLNMGDVYGGVLV